MKNITNYFGERARNLARYLVIFLLFLGVFGIIGVPSTSAATFTVNTTADTVDIAIGNGACLDAGGNCSLRAAIQEANALAGADIINLGASTYTLTIAGAGENASATGDLDINQDLTINGTAANSTIIDGSAIDRVFQILRTTGANVTVSFNELTIKNGNMAGDGGGVYCGKSTDATTGRINCNFTSVEIDNNTAYSGGGLSCLPDHPNGAINFTVNCTLNRVTLAGNTANNPSGLAKGGGFFCGSSQTNHFAICTLYNATISGNTATSTLGSSGGGMVCTDAVDDNCFIYYSTIANNTSTGAGATSFGGGWAKSTGVAGNTHMEGVLIVNNTADFSSTNNCTGDIIHAAGNDYNFENENTCLFVGTHDQINTAITLDALALNDSGVVKTRALTSDDLAVDTGATDCTAPLLADQDATTKSRPLDGVFGGANACDIGSYELPTAPSPTPTVTPTSGPTPTGNCVWITPGQADPTPGNNFICENTTVVTATPTPTPTATNTPTNTPTPTATSTPAVAELAITKTDNPDPVVAGQNITYTLTLTNNGPNAASGMNIIDVLPTALQGHSITFVSCTPASGTCNNASGTITWSPAGSVANGATTTATVVVTVGP